MFYISLHFLTDINRRYCLSIFRTILWVGQKNRWNNYFPAKTGESVSCVSVLFRHFCLFSVATTTKPFHEQKQYDLRSRRRTSSYGESNPVEVQEKPPEFYPKRWVASKFTWPSPHWRPMAYHWRSCMQRSDSEDDGRTKSKVTASLAKHSTRKPKGASSFHAAMAQKRYTEQWGALWILLFQQGSKETKYTKLENFHWHRIPKTII